MNKTTKIISTLLAISVIVNVFFCVRFYQNNKFVVASTDQAIDSVMKEVYSVQKLIEDVDSLNKISKTGDTVHVRFDTFVEDKNTYIVRVFQDSDADDLIHTQGWYYVDAKTGRVSEKII